MGPIIEAVIAQGHTVLVVDDGSTDNTAEVAAEAGAEVARHEHNLGKGEAIRTAARWLLERGYGAGLYMDADGQHLPAEIGRFVECYNDSQPDLIIGVRMAERAHMPWLRRMANMASSRLVSRAAGRPITDSQSGFRLLSAKLLKQLGEWREGRFELESAMIIDAVRGGFTYAEVAISCVYDPERKSRFRTIVDSFRFLRLVARKLWQWR